MDKVSRIKFYFVCCLITLNGLFIGYAVGLNSRHVLIVDPNLPKYVKPVIVKPVAVKSAAEATTTTKTTTKTTTTETKKIDGKGVTHDGKSSGHAAATGKSAHGDGGKQTGVKPVSKPNSKPTTHGTSTAKKSEK